MIFPVLLSALLAAPQTPEPQVFAPGVISSSASDLSPAFTADGQTVFFTRGNASQLVILESHLVKGHWSTPVIAPFSGVWRDLEATMAPDGRYLIFASNRPATTGGPPLDGHYNGGTQPAAGGNLWRVDRTAHGWGEPHRLPDIVNPGTSVFSPSIAGDGSLYFMQPDGPKGRFHLYRSQLTAGSYQTPVRVTFSAAPDTGDYDPAVAPDESFLIFSSGRSGGGLFITFRRDTGWSVPVSMGAEINQPGANNIEARLSPDHRTLYWSSVRVLPPPDHLDRSKAALALKRMLAWNNGQPNIWYVPLDFWLGAKNRF
jgi:hypothetical protein